MNFPVILKPPTSGDQKETYRWLYQVCEILNGLKSIFIQHDSTQNLELADDTSSNATGYKHVTDAQIKVYGDHVRLTNNNPHGTNWDQLEETASVIPFNTGASTPAYAEGKVFYDFDSHSLAYYNDASGVTVNIAQEQLVRVHNTTGSNLTDGQLVYISGAASAFPSVTLAKADTSVSSQSTLGMITHTILNGGYGYATTSGIVHDLNTNAYAPGTVLYLSATTAGAWTSTAPLQPNYVVEIGTVTEQSATSGAIYVHIDKKQWFPSVEVIDTTASIVLPTTPTVIKPPTTVYTNGFAYNSSTGILTFNETGAYGLTVLLNAEPSASNKNVYFYIETNDNGAGWVISRYSARVLKLPNAVETQLLISGQKYFPKGTAMRFYVWGEATVTLKTTDLPGTTPGTVTMPAFRLMIS